VSDPSPNKDTHLSWQIRSFFCRSLRPDDGRLAEEGGGFRRFGLIRQLSLEELEAARRIIIGEDVWLGGGAIVCLGVTIGADAVVGAAP
jgi:hypothetical protein